MTIARFKDLCVDVNHPSAMTAFWGRVIGLTAPADNPNVLVGDTPEKTIWINKVDEPRTVKQRVHLDVQTGAIGDLQAVGATIQSPATEEQRWTVMEDPEGGELCGFVRETVPAYRLMELVVDAGATLLRPKDDEIGWHVCADPEGNEFCVFLPPAEEA